MRKKKGKHLTESQLERLAGLYPDTENEDLADLFGVSVWTIRSRAFKHKWHKSDDFISRQRSERAVRCNSSAHLNTSDAVEKRNATRKRTFDTERMRLRWGLEQKTHIHIRLEPRDKLLQRNRLQRLGYIIDEKNLTAYWTAGTHRAIRLEAVPRGTTKGTIHPYYDFRPYDGEQ